MIKPEILNRPSQTTLTRWLSIVGIGEDGLAGLPLTARRLIEGAELVVGGARHLELAAAIIQGERLAWPSPLTDAFPKILAARGRPVVVLASGDPFHFGIGKQLAALVGPDEMLCLPHRSAFSLAAARLGWPLQDVAAISLHGRATEGIIRYLQPGARILALTWDGTTPRKVAELLTARGFGRSRVWVLEAMGGPRERIQSAISEEFDLSDADPLNTIAVELVEAPGAQVIGLAPGLDDTLFENDGQLTRREIRAVTLSSLAPRQGELLCDIGLGAGSVAIEWLLCHPTLRAIGLEERPDRAARAARNAATLGAVDLDIRIGQAPEALAGLPQPHCIFIGGGLSEPGVLDAAWSALGSGGRLVANAVTLESEAILLGAFQRRGGDMMRIGVDRAERVGSLYGWRAAMPVLHWRVTKP